ncbi:MAG: hypothetical protein HONBIEJF_01570 [Fimbriimonadaceae bacterium]|nr:hypothetical protein [Fimbriimonadaceae bacterium]
MEVTTQDWMYCDGAGGLSRRALFRGAAAMGLGALFGKTALSQVAVSTFKPYSGNVLVVIFLRGGADGLSMIVPYREDEYHRNRPATRIEKPIDLDGQFGLHPSLAPLLEQFREGHLACVHAVGSDDQTRSHFEAMNAMEFGMADQRGGLNSGWLTRYLKSAPREPASPLRAVALGGLMPDSLRGGTHATAIRTLAEYSLQVPPATHAEWLTRIAELYSTAKDEMAEAGQATVAVLKRLKDVQTDLATKKGTDYPNTDLGRGLREVAYLIRSDFGVEVACLDRGGWDTHVAQNNLLPGNLEDVAKSIHSFVTDLGELMARVTVVVQTEFGRRLHENAGLGTDHGRGGVMFILGGGVNGGRVVADWPTLQADRLDETGDLRVTTDYRDVLTEVIQKRLSPVPVPDLFPGLNYNPVKLFD